MPKYNTFTVFLELRDEYLADRRTRGVPSKRLELPIKYLTVPASALLAYASGKSKASGLEYSLTEAGHKYLNAEQVKFYDSLVNSKTTNRIAFGFACAVTVRYHVSDAVLTTYANTRMRERVNETRIEYRTARARVKALRQALKTRKRDLRVFLGTDLGSKFVADHQESEIA